MKIRHKITLAFSLVVIIILLLMGGTVYFFSAEYRKNEFYNRLKQRTDITEKIQLEKHHFSAEENAKIQEQFLNKLPEETEEVIPLTHSFRHQLQHAYPEPFLEKLLQRKEAYFQTAERQGAGKIFHVNGHDYLVLLTAVDRIGIRMMDHLQTVIIIALALAMMGVGVVSYLVAASLLKPISQKIRTANSISASNLHERLTVVNPDDEIGELAIAFNNLLDRVAKAFEAQRLFIDNASHEIRNPLTAIMGEAEVALEKQRTPETYIDSLKSISLEADRLNVLVNNLLQLSNINHKQVDFKTGLVDVKELLEHTCETLYHICPGHQVKLDACAEAGNLSAWLIEGNHQLLETAFINLLDNASKFSFHEEVRVSIHRSSGHWVVVTIQDKGVGIPEEDLTRITQPFHRADNVRQIKGTGIGIPLTLKIIELHKGTFYIESTLHQGTRVQVALPAVE